MWAFHSVFYQIYPLGFCGAPFENDGKPENRLCRIAEWIPHIKKLGVDALYLSPVFESDTHGYNTRDFYRIDCRLGTNKDFQALCTQLKENGIRIVLDGVFHHVGRGFWAFQDVLLKRARSCYCDWFYLDFQRDSPFQDGFWYEGWEGNYDLVKLNLQNPTVVRHLLDAVAAWIREFQIDGLRLDVAYSLDLDFLRQLRRFTKSLKPDFFLVGELLHGDYNRWVNNEMLDSATNYECYKGLYSSFNSQNLFEIMHSLKRQFGPENWTLYKGKHLFSFVDNHDVSRIATLLQEPKHLPLIYTLLFTMPGIPCIYYGSEWGALGDKQAGDPALRLCYEAPQFNALTAQIARLARLHKENAALCNGDFHEIFITNQQCAFERKCGQERIWVIINAAAEEYVFHPPFIDCQVFDLLKRQDIWLHEAMSLAPYSASVWKLTQ